MSPGTSAGGRWLRQKSGRARSRVTCPSGGVPTQSSSSSGARAMAPSSPSGGPSTRAVAWRRCGSRCSRASTRRTSTAAPACTSSTSSRELASLVDLDVLPRFAAHPPWDRPRRTARCGRCRLDLAPGHGRRGRRRRGPQPHVVRATRRPPGPAAVRHPARHDRPQPRAAAPLEGRAARRRLRESPRGASGPRSRPPTRCRRLARACARTSSAATRPSTPTACTWSTTASTPTSTGPTRHRRPGAPRRRPARPSVLFVGRITRQKGVRPAPGAAPTLDPDAQLVLCAGAPDTPEIGREVDAARRATWPSGATASCGSSEMLPRPERDRSS